jgi:hypothetical protein
MFSQIYIYWCDVVTGVVVYGENGKYIKKVTLKDAPFDIAFIPRIDQYVVTLPVINSIQFINKDFTLDKCVKVKYTASFFF